MRLLTFDDEEAIGRLVCRIGALAGFETTSVATAPAFMASLMAAPPDVIALDLQLGSTDGVEQLRVLAEQQYPGLLILMSGYDQRVLATAAAIAANLGLRVEATLNKPIRVAELEHVLERIKEAITPITPARVLQAIQNDELCIELQPIVGRNPNTLNELEALVRWDHPTMGRVGPNRFITVAESDLAVIDALTYWVTQAVIEAYLVLAELGLRVPIAMNVSMQNLHDLTLPDRLADQLQRAGMPPHHLCLEVTESTVFADAARSTDILTRTRLKGIRLAIDDFGTGYSSFKLLRQLPFSAIKIDRTFVGDLAHSRDSQAITKSIIDLAANMSLECIAEGVDTEAAATALEVLKIGGMQGYLFARPMPVESIPAWLQGWTRGRPEVLDTELSAAREPSASGDALRLSPRQREVMQLLARGNSAKEIARSLNIGISTVKVHLSLAYAALGARNRIEAIMRLTNADIGAGIGERAAGRPVALSD